MKLLKWYGPVVIFHQIVIFAHAIHFGAYLRGFRTSATSKTEHFTKIAIVFQKKTKKTVKKSAKAKKKLILFLEIGWVKKNFITHPLT